MILGDGGDPAVIDLSHDQVRTLVFGYRGGALDARLRKESLEPAVQERIFFIYACLTEKSLAIAGDVG